MKRLNKIASKKELTLEEFANLLTPEQQKQTVKGIYDLYGFDKVSKNNPIIYDTYMGYHIPFFETTWYAAMPAKGYTSSLEDFLDYNGDIEIYSNESKSLYSDTDIEKAIDFINDPNLTYSDILEELHLDFIDKLLDLFDIEE